MYLIDQAFTRLAPAIDFSDVALDVATTECCVLGRPPKHLQAVHRPALIKAWHARVVQAIVQPTQVENRKGHRRVQVLGETIFDFDELARVHAWVWTFSEHDLPELEQLPDHTVVAMGVPHQDLWMQGYRAGALRSLVAYYPAQARLCEDYVAWVSQALIALCWTDEVQVQVRSQIADALALDAKLLEIASQIQLSTRARVPVRLAHYNHVLTYQTCYLQLVQESPQFIALHALLADDLQRGLELTYSMKHSLRKRGLGAAVWRLLSRVGTQWINGYLPYFDQERQPLHACAIEIVQMAAAFGTQALPPSELLHALIQLGGNPNDPSISMVDRLDDLFSLCERLGVLAARADAATLGLLKEQAMAIFQWASDHAQSIPDEVMCRISLKGLLRKVQAQALLDKKRHASGQPWSAPYHIVFDEPTVSAVILNSRLAIWQEGQLMQHCADKFGQRCASGELLMVSLRDAEHRHPLATVSFFMNTPIVQIHKFTGFANRSVSVRAYALIRQCRQQLHRQRRVEPVDFNECQLVN